MTHSKAILLILDGWGIGKHDQTDAIYKANTPYMDHLMATAPSATLKTFGKNVGLPIGQMGNSEVGHLNIGAGRIVYQMLMLINKSFEDKSILNQPNFKKLIQSAKSSGKNIHLMGLVSNGGVHSSDEHLKALCGILKENNLDGQTYIHGFLDGRDCDPRSGKGFVEGVMNDSRFGNAQIASLVGRYYAMDRDKRWERVKLAYDALVHGSGNPSTDLLQSIEQSYSDGVTDEFMQPIIQVDSDNNPIATIKDGDIVLCFNFRTDRGR
ncbi:MAG: 2,3-bisphosphoglycerate-independent phosphoglycerate mutase, partial [Bacteroidia bacterium]